MSWAEWMFHHLDGMCLQMSLVDDLDSGGLSGSFAYIDALTGGAD